MLRRLQLTKMDGKLIRMDGIFRVTSEDHNIKKILTLFNEQFGYSWRYTYENIRNGNVFSYNISGEQVAWGLFKDKKPQAIYVRKHYRNIGIGTRLALLHIIVR